MKKLILAARFIALLLVLDGAAMAGTVYNFNSSGSWTCPPGVTSIQVECWGGGGAGGAAVSVSSGNTGGGGGGGGAYAKSTTIGVTPGNVYTVTVGTGGTSTGGVSIAGTASSFTGDSATISANGGSAGTSETANNTFGAGGAGGAANGSGVSFAGGTGATAVTAVGGGGGGSSAGTAATGVNGSATITGGTAPAGGGSGGSGSSSSASGSAGSYPGGGGSGAYAKSATQRNGGAGGAGMVAITVATPFAFTPGNLAVLLPSDSGANNTALTILEVAPNVANQGFVYTAAVDSSDSSGLHFSGSAGTSGYLADSGDGTLLAFTGANTSAYTPAVNAIAARGVGTLNAAGTYALQTTYTATVSPTTQPRGASTVDNVHWVIGDQGGMYTNGSTVPLPAGNFKAVKSFGGNNYVLTATAGIPVVMTFSGSTTNYLPGIPADANATDFYLISSGANGATFDVMYVIDNTSATAGTIYKYALVSGSWTAEGTYNTGLGGWGLCAATNSSGVNVYFTTGSGTVGNSVYQITDTAAWNSPIAVTPANNLTLYNAAPTALLKGIALVPVAVAPTILSSAATLIGTTAATLNGSVTYDGGAPLTDYGFYWSTTSPVTTGSTKAQVGTSDHSGAFTNNLTGLSPNELVYFRAYADNSAGNTLGSSDFSFYTLANVPSAPTVGSPTTSSLAVAITAGDGNPAATTYAIKETSTGEYVQAGGSLGAPAVFQTASTWGTITVTGLNPSTTYTFEAEAQNGAGTNTSFGASANGTTSTPPTPTISVDPEVLNFLPTLVSTTSTNMTYTVSGVHLVGNITITAPANFQISTSSGSGFGASVTLTPSSGTVAATTIYVQFSPASQTGYSANITHTTSGTGANNPNVAVNGIGAVAPSVTTQAANPTNTTSATLNGTVTATNGAPITDRGFYWSASSGVTPASTQLDEGGTTVGVYSKVLTGLSVNTVYYFRAYASNSVGFTLGGADVSFYTLANTPHAPTLSSPTTSTLSVAIGSGDGNPVATTYAIYVTNLTEYVKADGTLGATPVYQTASTWGTTTVTGLSLGTSYGFEVLAENGAGIPTAFGPVASASTANGPFTPDNIAVLSADVASANNTAFSIIEVNPNTASLVQTVPINGTSGADALRISGSAGSAPKLADSGDGSLLVIAAFNSTNSSSTANTITNRAVATLDVSNNFTLQTTFTGISGNQVRGAATVDNKTFYVGDAGGIYTNGTTAPLNTGNIGSIKSFGGVVYVLQSSKNTVPISTVSADGTTLTPLPSTDPGLTNRDSAAVDFYLVASGNNGSAYDILYILDETSATLGAINKFSLINGTWVSSGSFTTGFGGYGLAATLVGNTGVNLYVTTGDGTVANNSLYQLPDAAGWNVAPNISTSNLLYTAVGGATLKGVAFAPVNPLIVTSLADSGAGTLRQTIASAYSGAVIEFAPGLSGSSITLASTLTIDTNLTIDASALPAGIQINGNGSVEVFNVESGNTVMLNSLTITNGHAVNTAGGIYNDGTLSVNQSTLSGNKALSSGGNGGGILNDTAGILTVQQSTLSGNTAAGSLGGGGVYNNGILTVNQSTLSKNQDSVAGGGIYNDASGTLTVTNSIVAGDTGPSDIDNEGTETFAGTNIVQNLKDNGTTTGSPGITTAPLLAPLGNYGGPTLTMPPTNGSPAIGGCTTTFTTDQRGFTRVSLATADIGSVGYAANPAGAGLLNSPAFNRVAGTFQFSFINYTFLSFTVYGSTNLAIPGGWVNLGPAVESPSGSGHYQFSDTPPVTDAQRFYRVSSP